jgi:hypothetical protein
LGISHPDHAGRGSAVAIAGVALGTRREGAARRKDCASLRREDRRRSMIRPLRQRHRYGFIVLGALLPATVAIGLSWRSAITPSGNLPASITPMAVMMQEIWTRTDLFAGHKIATRLLRSVEGEGLAIELVGDLSVPDLLIYWSLTVTTADLPADAVLLGGFPQKTAVPPNIAGRKGQLILYSLANHEVVAASRPLELSN